MHRLDFQVRSYECDLQGIVNNANYQHYLEHSRHEFLKTLGINFTEMHEQGLDLVLIEANLKYISSLKADDEFYVITKLQYISKLKLKFTQLIYKSDDTAVLEAEMTGTCIDRSRNKPVIIKQLQAKIS